MRALIATVSLALLSALAHAEPACEAKAAEKKLAGAAKTSFIKKCEKDAGGAPSAAAACEKSADDKKLAGAARTSHIKKCTADAASAPK